MARTESLPHRRFLTRSRKEGLFFFIFISPWILGFLIFLAGPIIASFYFSLTYYDVLDPPEFLGLQNYQDLMSDDLFWRSLRVTTEYSLFSVPLGVAFALGVALLLNMKIPFIAFFRTIYYLPSVVSGVAVAVLWLWILNPAFGILNWALETFLHIRGPQWLYDEQWALPALVLMSLWSVGGSMILYLAGLQGVPTELYEAASLDGAHAGRRFWHITLPGISPVLLFTVITGLINSFQTFTQASVMTQGGPHYATFFYVYYLWQTAFGGSTIDMGYASAMAWILFVLVFLLTILLLVSSRLWVFYEGAERGG